MTRKTKTKYYTVYDTVFNEKERSLSGREFNHLQVIKPVGRRQLKNIKCVMYECFCKVCGNICEKTDKSIKKGTDKSCGCLNHIAYNKENDRATAIKRRIYQHTLSKNRKLGTTKKLPFDVFVEMIDKPCFYCSSIKQSYQGDERNVASKELISDVVVRYNGIDRIDNSVGYTIENAFRTCCVHCNRAKLQFSEEDFKEHLTLIYQKWIIEKGGVKTFLIENNPFKHKHKKVKSLDRDREHAVSKTLYSRLLSRGNKRLGLKSNLNYSDFLYIINQPCFYCNRSKVNKRADKNSRKIISDYVLEYNGVDRLDSDIGYVKNNCVPCCTRCNHTKNKMHINEFYEWMIRVHKHFIKGTNEDIVSQQPVLPQGNPNQPQ